MSSRSDADSCCPQSKDGTRRKGNRPGGRPPALCETERRERIIDAAARVLQDHGYQDASMDRVAASSGMSKKTLYQLFDSKQALFGALMVERLLATDLCGLTLEGETSAEKLTFGMMTLANEFLRPTRLGLLRALIAEVTEMPEVSTHMRCYFEGDDRSFPIHAWLTSLGFNEARCGCTIDAAAEHLFGMTVGLLTLGRLMQFKAPKPEAERNAFIAQGVSLFLKSINFAEPTAT